MLDFQWFRYLCSSPTSFIGSRRSKGQLEKIRVPLELSLVEPMVFVLSCIFFFVVFQRLTPDSGPAGGLEAAKVKVNRWERHCGKGVAACKCNWWSVWRQGVIGTDAARGHQWPVTGRGQWPVAGDRAGTKIVYYVLSGLSLV